MEDKEEYLTELQRKQLKILKHYGSHKQLNQLVEECAELIIAIQKQKRYASFGISDSTIEEMADVKNLIEQLELHKYYVAEGVKTVKGRKIDRQLERIKGEDK
ncbi:MAG TPA: hypothetical protein VFD17_03685 [Clostridia bacterium]|nr:hypothetical protein [Clostridia bacterium]